MSRVWKIASAFVVLQIATAFAAPPPPPTTKPATITWENAKKHVGETITATGPVIGTHPVNSGKWLILNIGKDYPDPARLMILIKGQVSESDYKNKFIRATGKVVMYQGSPQIMLTPADVTANSAAPAKPRPGSVVPKS